MGVNLQSVAATGLCVAGMYWLRSCSTTSFFVVVGATVAYSLFADRTYALGRLKGKAVLVTGASSGLGKEIALEAARRGASKVMIVARSLHKLAEVGRQIDMLGGETTAVVLASDVTDKSALRSLISRVQAEGGIDLLVNNAGAGAWKHVEDTTPEEADAMMALPYGAAFAATSLLLPQLASRGGHVLNVTSAAAMSGFRGAVGYATARWAMRGFSQNLQHDAKELRVGVTLLTAAEIGGTEYFADSPGKAVRERSHGTASPRPPPRISTPAPPHIHPRPRPRPSHRVLVTAARRVRRRTQTCRTS